MDRLKIFQILIFVAASVIILRLFYWQLVSQIGQNATSAPQDEIPAPRGEIFTSDGFPIVANQEAFLVYGEPHEVRASANVAQTLAPYLVSEKFATLEASLSDESKKQKEEEIKNRQKEIENKLENRNLLWVQLARKAPRVAKVALEQAAGIGFEPDPERFYPEASMAAHVLGFVASDKFGQDTGYFGLEGFYDRLLRGQPGKIRRKLDPFGLPILVDRYRQLAPRSGAILHLSLDRVVQFIVEEKLKSAVVKHGARDGTVIVADPQTGHILAMATYPNYHPGARLGVDEQLYKNPAVADSYEPGSTFKLFATAAALELSLVTPETRCDVCTGSRQIGGFEISTWNKKYFPNSTVTEIIEHSDNVGMTFVAEKLGIDRLYDYLKKFGFGEPTGIDLQEETAASIREKSDWRPIDLATASFGQGIAVTPIQMIQAVSTFANGGRLITPKITEIIEDGSRQQRVSPDQDRQIISAKTAALVTEMMTRSVEKGEARAFAPKGYKIAGKTGTAQIPVAGHYDPEKTIASFIGFAPADDPKFVMLVLLTEPSSSPFGSETAAPTFFEIARELFNYFGVPPQKE